MQLAPSGVQLTPGMMGDDRGEQQAPEIPPEQENLIASMVAQATMAMQGQQAPQQDPAQVDAARQAEMDAAENARKDAALQAEIARGDAKTAAEIGLKTRAQEADLRLKTISGLAKEQEGRQRAGVQPASTQQGGY